VTAASRGIAVGIDIEATGEAWPIKAGVGFDRIAFAPTEREDLARLPPEGRDAWRRRAWVRKEAVLKATGLGLAVDPDTLLLEGDRVAAWPLELDPEFRDGVSLVDLLMPDAGTVAALAWLGRVRAGIVHETIDQGGPG
jgi:4'-phosphopantetheinyl transferase